MAQWQISSKTSLASISLLLLDRGLMTTSTTRPLNSFQQTPSTPFKAHSRRIRTTLPMSSTNSCSSSIISITPTRTVKVMLILSLRPLPALLASYTGPLLDPPPPALHGVNRLPPDFLLNRSMDSSRNRSSLASPFTSRKLPSSCSTLIPVSFLPLPSPFGKRCCRTSPRGSSLSTMTSSSLVPSQAKRRWYVFRGKYTRAVCTGLLSICLLVCFCVSFLSTIWTNTGSMFFLHNFL